MTSDEFKEKCKKCYHHLLIAESYNGNQNLWCKKYGKQSEELSSKVVTDREHNICMGFLENEFTSAFVERCNNCGYFLPKTNFCSLHEEFMEEKASQKVNCDKYIELTESNIINKSW